MHKTVFKLWFTLVSSACVGRNDLTAFCSRQCANLKFCEAAFCKTEEKKKKGILVV